MRRFSHDGDWSFAPVLDDMPPYPKRMPFRLSLKPGGMMARLFGERMDVVIGRQRLRCRWWRPFAPSHKQSIDIKDFIGVAVRFAGVKKPSFRAVMRAAAARVCELPLLRRLPFAAAGRALAGAPIDGYQLYLLHENCERDVLLYQSLDDGEITALWQFWSERLGLPKLLVDRYGMIEEADKRCGTVAFRRAFPRRDLTGAVKRRPVFGRVRQVGCQQRVTRHVGREIMARR